MTLHPSTAGRTAPRARAVATAAVVVTAVLSAVLSATPAAAATPVASCANTRPTLIGTDGPDRLIGTNGDDVVVANGGDDVVFTGGGNDIVCAGPGNDKVDTSTGADRVYGQDGNDHTAGGPGSDRLDGGNGADRLDGGAGADVLEGGPGADTLVGGTGVDRVVQRPGDTVAPDRADAVVAAPQAPVQTQPAVAPAPLVVTRPPAAPTAPTTPPAPTPPPTTPPTTTPPTTPPPTTPPTAPPATPPTTPPTVPPAPDPATPGQDPAPPPPPPPPATSGVLVVSPVADTLSKGLHVDLVVTHDQPGDQVDVQVFDAVLTSSNPAVLSVSGQRVTALGLGTATVTASRSGVAPSAPVGITVTAPVRVDSYVSGPTTIESTDLSVYIYSFHDEYSDGTSAVVLNSEVAWAVNDVEVGVLLAPDEDQLDFRLLRPTGPGAATVTATRGGETFTLGFTVAGEQPQSIDVSPDTSLPLGSLRTLTTELVYGDGSRVPFTDFFAVSADTEVADVAFVGDDFALTVIGTGLGTTTVTVTAAGLSDSLTVDVTEAEIAYVEIRNVPEYLEVGTPRGLTAVAVFTNSDEEDVTASVLWSSGNTAVATVDTSGLVTPVSAGTAPITATLGAHEDTRDVVVSAAPAQPA